MSGFPLASFSVSERGLFSTAEIRQLMVIEHGRASRYGYAVALLLIEVDRLETMHDLYGVESKREILNGVVRLLRSETRGSDFIGCLDDDRIMALFPHTGNEGISSLASRLLRSSRRLDFQSDGRLLRATVSIGASVAEPESGFPFEQLVRATQEALRFAIVEGGDRFVLRQPASDFFEELRGELEEEARLLGEEHRRTVFDRERERQPRAEEDEPRVLGPRPLPAVGEPSSMPLAEGPLAGTDGDLTVRIHELFATFEREGVDWLSLEHDVIALVSSAIARAREEALDQLSGDHARRVDVLERRVAKLKDLLDSTEAELMAIARMKGIDTGVASIYRTVQGLTADEQDFERKKEMLTLLFEANVELRRQIKDKP